MDDVRFEILRDANGVHWRLNDEGEVVVSGADTTTVQLAHDGAVAAKAAVAAAMVAPTPGDIVSIVTYAALGEIAAASIVDLTAGNIPPA